MRLGWGHDDGAFFFSRADAAQQECGEPGFTLLCMGLFSRFQALPCTAEGTVCRVRDTRSLVPRAYGTNRSSSNTSCSKVQIRTMPMSLALPSPGPVASQCEIDRGGSRSPGRPKGSAPALFPDRA